MPYIGRTPLVGNYQKCDALNASATADYTLQVGSSNVVPESVNHMIVSLNGVIQSPTTAYTVSGSTLSFSSSLTSNDSIDFILLLGNVLDIGTPSDDTCGAAQIKDDLISGTTALTAEPASTDELLISDAGTLKRIDYSLISNTPAFKALSTSTTSIANVTNAKMTFDTEVYDTDGCYDHASNYRFTPTTAGQYIFFIRLLASTSDDIDYFGVKLYKNGSVADANALSYSVNRDYNSVLIISMQEANGSSDYFEAYCYHQEGDTQDVKGMDFSGFKLIGV